MVTIRTATQINAPLERCFRLSLSIDLEMAANQHNAVAGVTKGLIGPGETVTWQARHFGWKFRHESLIDVWRPYSYFRDVMIRGAFTRFEHEHFFVLMDDGTRMRDELRFCTPWGPLGRLATKIFLRRYLATFVMRRNAVIKRVAESEEWHTYLDGQLEMKRENSGDGGRLPNGEKMVSSVA